jgi:hypothetical protein
VWTGPAATSPVTPPPVNPTPITFGTGPDSLVFQICEDAYANGDGTSDAKGDATFTVSIDGKQIGGTFTAVASHAAGQEQTVTLNGYFGPGAHTVAVTFLNDANGGTAATDRNLYVDAVSYRGANTNQSGALMANGPRNFAVSGGTSVTPPPAQIVLTPTSGGSITDAAGNTWTITTSGDIDENGALAPGGNGSAAVTYVASTQTVWGEDAASLGWYSWTNGVWTGPAATSPVTPPPVNPAPVTAGTGPDALVLKISEDAYANHDKVSDTNGDATFTVKVDGKKIGGTFTALASHAGGQDQIFTLDGYFGSGAHTATVTFLNDAYGGTATTDRNLYVDAVSYRGANTSQSGALMSDGSRNFAVSGGTTKPVITVQTGTQPVVTVDGTVAHSETDYGAVVKLTSPGVASVTLGTTADTMKFIAMSAVSVTEGSATSSVTADGGKNSFVAGKGALTVTGGPGADAYLFHSGNGNLTVNDFSLAKGDTLTIDNSLKSAFHQASDGNGGTMISFGSANLGRIDLMHVASLPNTGVHFV